MTSEDYSSKDSFYKKIQDQRKTSGACVITKEEAMEWKKDSIPFEDGRHPGPKNEI